MSNSFTRVISAPPGTLTYAFAGPDYWLKRPSRHYLLESALEEPCGPILYVWDGDDLVLAWDLWDEITKKPLTGNFIDMVYSGIEAKLASHR